MDIDHCEHCVPDPFNQEQTGCQHALWQQYLPNTST